MSTYAILRPLHKILRSLYRETKVAYGGRWNLQIREYNEELNQHWGNTDHSLCSSHYTQEQISHYSSVSSKIENENNQH